MIDKARPATDGVLNNSEHEAFFVAQQYFRRERPSLDEIIRGIVDGEKDCGVDGMYILANGFFVTDDASLTQQGRSCRLDLVIFQVKDSPGFSEAAIDKLIINLPRLLDFNRDEKLLSKTVNPKLLEVTRRFLAAYMELEMPIVSVTVVFSSLKSDQVHPNTREKAKQLEETIKACFGSSQYEVVFLDAASVADLARQPTSITRKFPLAENPISTDTAGGYICVVRLKDYFSFITNNDSNKLDASLFEANVRDYEGATDVNASIQDSLLEDSPTVDFWWLNNGITIVADRVQPANKMLELESPQVVNGLQTSHEIHKLGTSTPIEKDERSLLVKVIEAQDGKIRDRIIRATNSQTSLGSSALRATDKVQRQIEELLRHQDFYYERRKNQYLNEGHNVDSLVSMNEMGQALLSQFAQFPHIARGENSRIFDEEIYENLFAPAHPIGVYSTAIRISRACRDFLRNDSSTAPFVEDFQYHLMMLSAISTTRKLQPKAKDLAVATSIPAPDELRSLLAIIREVFGRHADLKGAVLFDQIAKDPQVTDNILGRARGFLITNPPVTARTRSQGNRYRTQRGR